MLHDILILIGMALASYLAALVSFVFHRTERFDTRLEWWRAEGMMIFFLALVGLLLLGLASHLFHSLR